MDMSTRLFGKFCLACALTVVGIVGVISLGVMVWMTVLN